MLRTGVTVREATEKWVSEFDRVPLAIVEKLLNANENELEEVTPPAAHDYVYIFDGEYSGCEGEILSFNEENGLYVVRVDGGTEVEVDSDSFEVRRYGFLPMWGTMWAFSESLDSDWLEDNLQVMADCGFRIYEQEDYGYLFGIDGAGYDFYKRRWIPLYKARGLNWHDPDAEEEYE